MKRKLRLFWYNLLIRYYEKMEVKCLCRKRPFYKLANSARINATVYQINYLSWYYNL